VLRDNTAASSARKITAKSPCDASLPVAYRLYLPQEWAKDRERRRKAGVPAEVTFKTKHEIALDQLRWACAAGLPRGVVLEDAAYGNNSDLRADITALGLANLLARSG
jgi:SRSO17 transposase